MVGETIRNEQSGLTRAKRIIFLESKQEEVQSILPDELGMQISSRSSGLS